MSDIRVNQFSRLIGEYIECFIKELNVFVFAHIHLVNVVERLK